MAGVLPVLVLAFTAASVAAQDRVVRLDDNGLQPPRKVVDVPPEYPASAREEGVGGVVRLDVTVGTDGRTRDIGVVESPDERLSAASVTAVRQWEYEVTRLNGEPVAVAFTVTISFNVT